ncbi:hypothetical protein K2Z83_27335 [Oscillochloris sp. ZM17-4]|uniref:hypothetical protein n=1 Tax=Oscillochloris sp. ZM17-4 TaxID=2866714 RepID=UPI001C731ED9|nr:hypothetical protein [Oscillochloris sp. ZM17-4]MBX0331370.1 hypothetical protein [Oscillochloris sp. ZM17-4]
MTSEPLTLTMTTDEVLAVLQVMGASTMNGLGEPLAGLSEHDQAARLNAGAETLLNRGLCRIENDQLVMDDMMVAFVGASLIPDAVLLLSALAPDQTSDPHYFNATQYLAVEHLSPRPGVHEFIHLASEEVLVNRLEMLLAAVAVDTARAAQPETWTIADPQLNEALQAIRASQSDTAREIFAGCGLSGAQLDELLGDLTGGTAWVAMAGWGLREPSPSGGSSMIIYIGQHRYWLFSPCQDAPGDLLISNPDGKECMKTIMRLAAPLRELMRASS